MNNRRMIFYMGGNHVCSGIEQCKHENSHLCGAEVIACASDLARGCAKSGTYEACDHALRQSIVASARSWLNTPFHPQGRVKNVGCDCIGLVIGVARELGAISASFGDCICFYDMREYHFIKDSHILGTKMDVHFAKRDMPWQIGDILFFRFTDRQMHIAFISDVLHGTIETVRIIHSCCSAGKVVEHIIQPKWLTKIAGHYMLVLPRKI